MTPGPPPAPTLPLARAFVLGAVLAVGTAALVFWTLSRGGGAGAAAIVALAGALITLTPFAWLAGRARAALRDEQGRAADARRALDAAERAAAADRAALAAELGERTQALERQAAELRQTLERLGRAQDDLVRTEKLASMGRLVAGIAHEINNPMNAVINTLGPLEETLDGLARSADATVAADAAGAVEMLKVVQRGATRARAIVQALHNYSRGDTETLREVNVLRSIDDTLGLLQHRLRNIEVVKEIQPGVRVSGFAGQIDQILMNLLTNAVQAIGNRKGTIRITMQTHKEEVVLTIGDDGPGIPPEVLPRIFDPFFTTKDVGEGAGLGLSIVHGIVERHGGRIQVESRPGAGTTFRVYLPVFAGFIAAARPVGAAP